MGKPKKKIAKAPDGMEYIWLEGLGIEGFIRPNKEGASDYQFSESRMVRTERLHTHEGRRCLFVDMPVFEVEPQGESR